jgi:hypothetical protein
MGVARLSSNCPITFDRSKAWFLSLSFFSFMFLWCWFSTVIVCLHYDYIKNHLLLGNCGICSSILSHNGQIYKLKLAWSSTGFAFCWLRYNALLRLPPWFLHTRQFNVIYILVVTFYKLVFEFRAILNIKNVLFIDTFSSWRRFTRTSSRISGALSWRLHLNSSN